MKKRSEIVKKRSEVKSPADAAARTLPLAVAKPAKSGSVKCGACDEIIELTAIKTFRDDKSGECPSCGGSISSAQMNDADEVVDDDGDARTRSEMKAKHGPLNPERKWCGTCGSEWPIVNGNFFINCGHTHAARIDDPRKATNYGPPVPLNVRVDHERAKRDAEDAADAEIDPKKLREQDDARLARSAAAHAEKQEAKKDSRDTSTFNSSAPMPKITIEGNRMSVGWGKSTFPLGMMTNFTVGDFFASVEHAPGERLKAFREILGDFEKMANEAFAKQSAWYQEKLGTLK